MRLVLEVALAIVATVLLAPGLALIGGLLGSCAGLLVGAFGPIVLVVGLRGVRKRTAVFEKHMDDSLASLGLHLRPKEAPSEDV